MDNDSPVDVVGREFFSSFFLSNSQKSKVIGKARMKIDVAGSDGVLVR